MILTNCNCAEKIDCGCTVGFDSYESESISVLSVGNLIGGDCTFDEYVIDWYRDGEHALVSGVGNDPDIEAFHPFLGVESIPVIAGTYVPVIRYVIIAGEVIFGTNKKCRKWCEDLLGLPNIIVITVLPIECGLVGTDYQQASTYYDFKLSYNTSQNWALASRKVKFVLDETAKYFAFAFRAYIVSDQIKIYHSNDLNTPIANYVVGDELVDNWESDPPYIRATQYTWFKVPVILPEYTPGAYLIIEILPAVITANPNTNWDLEMVCLDSSYVFECDFIPESQRVFDPDTIEMVWNSAACRFEATFEFAAPWPVSSYFTNLFRYSGLGHSSGGSVLVYGIRAGVSATHQTQVSQSFAFQQGFNTKVSSYGDIYLSKIGLAYVIECDDINDFNEIKASYEYLMSSNFYTNWVDDNTEIAYYRYFYVRWITTSEGCGDNESLLYLRIFIDSNFDFNSSTKTITITTKTISNGLTTSGDSCNTVYSNVSSIFVTPINQTANRTDFSASLTKCRYSAPFGYGVFAVIGTTFPFAEGHFAYRFESKYNPPCEIDFGFKKTGVGYFAEAFYLNLRITASLDANGDWIDNPLENYEVQTLIDKYGNNLTPPYPVVYKKVNGVVTVSKSLDDI